MANIRIFISSPGDVGHERRAAAQVIARLGAEMAGTVELESYFWEHEPMHAGEDFQKQIPELANFDVFVCILWSRLGTRLHAQHARPDGSRYRSGTEYEFETALTAFRQSGQKNPLILIYRRGGVPSFPAEPEDKQRERQEQWSALKHFFEHWFTDLDDGGTFKAAFNLYQNTAEFEERLEEHLRKAIQTSTQRTGLAADLAPTVAAAATATWKGESPYRGLEVFEFEHAPIFFGRTRAVDAVINQLLDRASEHDPCPFTLILGASGSGKSSLLRAGVVPALVAGGVDGIGLWRRAVMRPGQAGQGHDLFDALAAALVQPAALPELAVRHPPEKLAALLRDGEGLGMLFAGSLPQIALRESEAEKARLRRLADEDEQAERQADAEHKRRLIGELRFPEPRLILAVDQLEEIFTQAKRFPPENRQRFVRALDSLARSGFVWVAATLRSDFFARCAEIPGLVTLASGKGQFHLLPPNGVELGQMIRRPAQAAGIVFENDPARGRLDDVLRDAAVHDPAALPLLEFALDQLFLAGGARRVLTHADYDRLGGEAGAGLRGVFVRTADEIWRELSADARDAFPAVFRRLATIDPAEGGAGETTGDRAVRFARRPVPLPRDDAPAGERELVAVFLKARLLVADADDAGHQFGFGGARGLAQRMAAHPQIA